MSGQSFYSELRTAARGLGKTPGVLAAAVLSLALGLGVNLALFHAAYVLLWRPLPFVHSDQLLTVWSAEPGRPRHAGAPVTGRQAALLREMSGSLSSAGLVTTAPSLVLLAGQDTLDLNAARVNSAYFQTLSLRPAVGGFFGEEEDLGENPEERAVLTETAWRARFGADAGVVGRLMQYSEGEKRLPVKIIGVVAGGTALPFASAAEILLPLASRSARVQGNAGDALYFSILRRRPETTSVAVSNQVAMTLEAEERSAATGRRYGAADLWAALAPEESLGLWLLCAAAALLLAVLCANLSSLLGARALERLHETAVRVALGAGRRHLWRRGFAEALVICVLGMGLGAAAHHWASPLLARLIPGAAALGAAMFAEGPVFLALGVVLCLVVALALAAPPLLLANRVDLALELARGGRTQVGGRSRLQNALVVVQLAVVLVLTSMGLIVALSFQNALRAEAGFEPRNVVALRLDLPVAPGALTAAASQLVQTIRALPGASGAAFSAESPMGSNLATVMAAREGKFTEGDPTIGFRLVSADYFRTLGARILQGRPFTEQEVEQRAPVMVLNDAAAKLLFPDRPALGGVVHCGFLDLNSTVIGVVRGLRHEALDKSPKPMVYLPYLPVFRGTVSFVVRTSMAPGPFQEALRARMAAAQPGAVVRSFRTLESMAAETVKQRLSAGQVVGGFALLGLLINALGICGVLNRVIASRRTEIGLRRAFGATPLDIVHLVGRLVYRVVAGGVLIGVPASIAAGYLARQALFGVKLNDAWVIGAAVLTLIGVSVLGCLPPLSRALRVDPAQALRGE